MIEPDSYLHRAPFVVPMLAAADAPPVITDGAVLTTRGRIVRVARYADLKGEEAELVEHEGSILAPGLVNCHAHLELSHLAKLGKEKKPGPAGEITAWIRELLAQRLAAGDNQEEHGFIAMQGLARLYATGCRAVADIGNLPESRFIGEHFKMALIFFLEFLGLAGERQREALELLDSMDEGIFCTAHAPYSSGPELIRKLKARSARLGHLFPIHVAESPVEVEFLRTGTGPFRDFLEERGALSSDFKVPGTSPVSYLDSLGALDDRTLCVHCVQVEPEEIDLLAKRRSIICLCPGSNRYMGVGKAPVPEMLAKNIRLVLGTDSLASNSDLNMWREMRILMEDHPDLDPDKVFEMATRLGAEVLGVSGEMGSLASGCSASFLSVGKYTGGQDGVFEFLATQGESASLEWVE